MAIFKGGSLEVLIDALALIKPEAYLTRLHNN